jgi:hypothetical protein
MKFSKAIIWGHKENTHSHSYIHLGFYKALKHLGYDTYWLNDDDDVSGIDFNNSLFITECQVEKNIPISKTSKYISHNIGTEYISSTTGEILYSTGRPLKFNRFYEPDIIIDTFGYCSIKNAEKVNDYSYVNGNILIQPWATDLLPHEFDFDLALKKRKMEAYFFGTVVSSGWNNNKKEIDIFRETCSLNGIIFDYRGLYSKEYIKNEEAITLMRQATAAPAIQSKDQIDAGYISCRFFKNISYGHYGLTNCAAVYNIFNKHIQGLIYDDPKNMIDSLFKLEKNDYNKSILIEQMKYVQNNHTYINRLNFILERL